MDKDKYFKTSSFQLAVFLFVKELELVGLEWIEERRATFAFVNTPDMEQLVNSFNFGKPDDPIVMADVRKVLMSSKLIKDKLYQGRNERFGN